MKSILIDANDFVEYLFSCAITTSDYDFSKKVRYAIEQYIKSEESERKKKGVTAAE